MSIVTINDDLEIQGYAQSESMGLCKDCYVTSILGWAVKVGSSLISIKLCNDPQPFKMKLDFYNTITEGNYYFG